MTVETTMHGAYTATILREETTPHGLVRTWKVAHAELGEVGRLWDGPGIPYPAPSVQGSLNKLLWAEGAGGFPEDCADPKSPNYGIHFDFVHPVGVPSALAEFACRADRLIAWRKAGRRTK